MQCTSYALRSQYFNTCTTFVLVVERERFFFASSPDARNDSWQLWGNILHMCAIPSHLTLTLSRSLSIKYESRMAYAAL